jgi:hypothetical protein
MALKGRVPAVREGGTEGGQNVAINWKGNGATLKNMEGPAAHLLNRDEFECEITECVDEWQVVVIVMDGKRENDITFADFMVTAVSSLRCGAENAQKTVDLG